MEEKPSEEIPALPAPVEQTNRVDDVVNAEKRYNIAGRKGFLKNNSGRPKGAKHHSTRVREALLACVGRSAIRRFKKRLNGKSDPREFSKALDQVIFLLGPSKPLVDQSRHTHMTVILDGTPEPAPEPSE